MFRYRLYLPFLMNVMWPLADRYQVFAAFYYSVLDHTFYTEFAATIAGKRRFYEANRQRRANPYLLRRSIHRIEKGLCAPNRRDVFATSYIEHTVENYIACQNTSDQGLLWWAHDVLAQYFLSIGNQPAINRARANFQKREFLSSPFSEPQTPFRLKKQSRIDYEQMATLAMDRRSVRHFQDRPVEMRDLQKAAQIALMSPSACNRQPLNFYYFTKRADIEAVASIPKGAKGFMHQIPLLVAIVGDLSAFAGEDDRHVIYIDGGLAAMSFMYALESLGLSSCPINWPSDTRTDRRFQKLLGTHRAQRVILLIAVGYQKAEGLVPRSTKKNVSDFLVAGHTADLKVVE